LALAALAGMVLAARPVAAGSLLINDTYKVLRYNSATGAFVDTFVPAGTGGINFVTSMAWGPDGNLYIGDSGTSSICRYDGTTGAFIGTFVSPGSGGLDYPVSLAFGPDGSLYAANILRPLWTSGSVLKFDGTTGAFLGTFVASGSGGLNYPWKLLFGGDGNLYVGAPGNQAVLRYNGTTGAFIDTFVSAASGGLSAPKGMAFGLDGNLYVSSGNTNQVLRYNGSTGAFMGAFAALSSPDGVALGPDLNLYAGSATQNLIARFNGSTGAFLNTFVPAGSGGLGAPRTVLFLPPRAPSGLAAAATSSTQINLTWTDNSDDETAFSIWRQSGAGSWSRAGVVPPNSTSFSDTGLSPATSYNYRVRAICNVGASLWTPVATATTWSPPPAAPTNPTVTALSSSQINLTWTDNSNSETAFSVWRRSDGSGGYVRVAVLVPNSTAYSDTGLSANSAYSYKVRAINDHYASAWTSEACAWTLP
jgi:outer membrane protein assembly factor BamB